MPRFRMPPRSCSQRAGFGVTNLVVLDTEGNPIVDEQVTVVRQTASSVAERTSEAEMSAGQ